MYFLISANITKYRYTFFISYYLPFAIILVFGLFHSPLRSNDSKRKVKLKQSLYGPWVFQEAKATRFHDNRHMKVVRLSALCTGCLPPPSPQEIFLVRISVKGWDDPRAVVRPERFGQWKIPPTPSGIEPTTFRLVAQCLDQMRHRVPPNITTKQFMSLVIFGLARSICRIFSVCLLS